MNNKIVVCIGKGGQKDMAESFSRRTGSPIVNKPGDYLTVLFDSKGVSLSGFGLSYQGDFENMLHRVTNGRLQHEMLAKAVKTDQENLKAIDATAGMGEDSLLLAACGYQVTLYEQNPVIAILLKDALRAAKVGQQRLACAPAERRRALQPQPALFFPCVGLHLVTCSSILHPAYGTEWPRPWPGRIYRLPRADRRWCGPP